jgi:hypothetical protein
MRRAIVAVAFAVISLSVCAPLAAQETHPGGSWGAWLTLPQYPKLRMRVKCEYWITDQNDNNRAHSVWEIQYRSEYVRPMDVVQANTYYDTVLKTNKNWSAPGQFTLQPGQKVDYGETSVLGACPKASGASPINLAVYCVVPSGQVDQSTSCQSHGVPKKNEPGSSSLNAGKTVSNSITSQKLTLPVEETTWECRVTEESNEKIGNDSYLGDEFSPYRITFHSNGLFTTAKFRGQDKFEENNDHPRAIFKWHKTSNGVEAVFYWLRGDDGFEGNASEMTFVFINANKANVQVGYSKPFMEFLSSPSMREGNSGKIRVFGNGDHLTEGCTRFR